LLSFFLRLTFPDTPVIPPSLKDLLTKLLTKSPQLRITLSEVRYHAWTTGDLNSKERAVWIRESDPQFQERLHVTDEEVAGAVKLLSKMKEGWRKLSSLWRKDSNSNVSFIGIMDGGNSSSSSSGINDITRKNQYYGESVDNQDAGLRRRTQSMPLVSGEPLFFFFPFGFL